MEEQDAHFGHILSFYFRKGKNASQARKKLCAVYGNEALKERLCQNWFAKFHSGDISLKSAQQSGLPVEVDETRIKAIIDSDLHSTTREIAEKLNVSHTCIQKKLKRLGYVKKLDLWIPHRLKEIHLTQRISICDSLLQRNEINRFLKRLITGDEKWIVYNNVNRKRSWVMQNEPAQTIPKSEIHQKIPTKEPLATSKTAAPHPSQKPPQTIMPGKKPTPISFTPRKPFDDYIHCIIQR
ncbi:Histone-lysine N-methyltransferase SETMAR [Eufriesea mexicana]|uniref:Histone-lysine N-methyltransferase SETMAR n=1 Tax=Eufriesea mexicana TaxID=516756 RepID=A0A310SXN8_9HYME|nr:Histone-lysine N-methyltransferase SETMAR [Eufriesea mexicana]